MFRFLCIALVFITSSYQSLGAPVNGSGTLKNLFNTLANRCNSDFLKNEINLKTDSCSELPSSHKEKQLQCLMFYDINSQLCSAATDGKIQIPDDATVNINEEQDVNSLCMGTKDWVFTNLTEFPHYKDAVDKVFVHPIPCGKICGVEDILSDEANYFCKYFKWGANLMKNVATLPSAQQDQVNINPYVIPPESSLNPEVQPVEVAGNMDLSDLQIKNTTKETKLSETLNVTPSKDKVEQTKTDASKTETSSQTSQNRQLADPSNPINKNIDVTSKKVEDSVVLPEITKEGDDKGGLDVSQPQIPKQEVPKLKALEEAPTKTAKDSLQGDVDKEIQMLNHELDRKEPVLENPKVKQPSDLDDYQDSDEGKDGLGDTQGGDDGDDPLLDDLNNKLEEPKDTLKKVDTIVSTFTGEREYYPNPVQDDFTDDGDNFFPFFLTAIILVILLYVLYHNKNKVSKVFFGLLVEGRQSGRRRNSRGHAYRRLDTLEQAMSANTAAPPSKIIY